MIDPKIAISGAAGGRTVDQGKDEAMELGRHLATMGGIILTGATTGVPYYAAKGAKSVGGQVIGFSPASTYVQHIRSYRLPTRYHDTIFFTGQNYAGRDITLVDFSDAVISLAGRTGTLHEFTHAFERRKVVGVLLDVSTGTTELIPEILERAERDDDHVVLDTDPKRLAREIIRRVRYRLENGME
jgi:uncharacterized protein (TIGR00725 family)